MVLLLIIYFLGLNSIQRIIIKINHLNTPKIKFTFKGLNDFVRGYW